MKTILLSACCFLAAGAVNGQTFSWSGYTSGAMSYTTGILTTTITSSSPGFQNTTPRYYAAATVGSGQCGIAGGLAFEQLFGNITAAHVTLTMDFTQGNQSNGTCSSITFPIKDINSDESVQTFADWVEISATDGNNNAIPVANITAAGGSNKVVTTSGATRIIKGYNSGSYGSRSTTSCDNMTITVTPPAGVPLKRIVIKYHPDYTTSPNYYYNFSGPLRPAYQYISIGSIVASATPGCTPLPVELVSFTAERIERSAVISWVTASEKDNAQFILERTMDGELYETVAVVEGKGTTYSTSVYTVTDASAPPGMIYYRLKQIDFNGTPTYHEVISVGPLNEEKLIQQLHPNPANKVLVYSLNVSGQQAVQIAITDQLGRTIYRETSSALNGLSQHTADVADFQSGVYVLRVAAEDGTVECVRFVKE